MSTPDQPLPAGGPTREEIARIEVGHTAVAPRVARWLVAAFLTAIAAVPLLETAAQLRGAGARATPWSHLSDLPAQVQLHLARAAAPAAPLWRRVVAANREALARLTAFERALDDESLLGRTLRRPAQRLMTGWLGGGNERVYTGRDGWLFYRPDVEYITGRGFLDPAQLERRVAAASEWTSPPQPDPRAAILRFRDDLQARGIALVVMPTPLKPGVHPEMLGGGQPAGAGVLQNRSFPVFLEDLRRAGILVFDPGQRLGVDRAAGPQYLLTDTHWMPETMEGVAELLAGFIDAHVPLAPTPEPAYRIEQTEVRNVGDTARMLDLPADDPLFPPEAAWLRRILLPDGSLWRASRTADVLLLGDSFSNIYALESMGWGTSAGFAEHLSLALRRPVDRLVQNDEGAFATRAMLQREPARLDGKRLVVYQFAARELAFGDWRVLPLPSR